MLCLSRAGLKTPFKSNQATGFLARWNVLGIALGLSLGLSICLAQEAANPLKGSLGVHDPVCLKSDETYFIFATGAGVASKTSTDRVNWKNGSSVFASSPAWHKTLVPNAENSLWAPDISFRNGKYWLYYSVSSFGSNTSAIGLATTPALNASGRAVWTDEGMVIRSISSNNYNAIDPNVATDGDGKVWLTFGSFWSGIKMVELDAATGKPLENATLYALANRSAGIEAPFLFRQGDFWYLFVSWDKCCQGSNSTYNIRVGRSAKITGPYLDSKGVDLAKGGGDLIDAGDARWKGPGHNAVFRDRDTVFLVNHAYDAKSNGASTLWIRPLFWTSAAWPTLKAEAGNATGLFPLRKPERVQQMNISNPSSWGWNTLGQRLAPKSAPFPLKTLPILFRE